MIKTLLIDDEVNSRKALRQLTRMYCPQIEIIGEAADIEEAYNMIQTLKPDLLFLDIEMPNGTGFDLLLKFPEPYFDIIFVTGFDHYAINAFKFSATDYLLKPIQTDELVAAVEKVRPKDKLPANNNSYNVLMNNLHQEKKNRQICILSQKKIETLKVSEIIYCESVKHNTIFHLTEKRQLIAEERIVEFENRFIDYDFFYRSHDVYLINLEYVVKFNKITQKLMMSNGESLPIAQSRKEQLIELLQH